MKWISCAALAAIAAVGTGLAANGVMAQVHEVAPDPNKKLSPLSATVLAVPILPPSDANVAKPPANGVAIYGALAKLPDWTQGAWVLDAKPSVLLSDASVPLTGKYAGQLAELRKNARGGRIPGNPACAPLGMPRFMQQTGPYYEFLYAADRVMIVGGNHETRIIFTDGRKQSGDPNLYYDGNSIGRWENGALIVETNGILPDSQPLLGIGGTGKLTTLERIHQTGPNTLQDDIVLSDPEMFAQPYAYTVTYTRHRDRDVMENLCLSNGSAYAPGKAETLIKETGPNPNPPLQIAAPAPNAASLPGGTWESIAHLPDWFGTWSYDNRPNALASTDPIPTTPAYTKILAELRAQNKRNEDIRTETYHCHPRGMPQMMSAATASIFNFIFVPGRMDVVPENAQVRHIFTDGRTHPTNLVPSFNGHSIGHWESNGTILVVETVAIDKEVQLLYGMDSSGKLTVTERFSQIQPNKLQIVTSIMDPVVLVSPYTYTRTYTLHRDWQIAENYCAQNNRDVDANTGGQSFNLTPPPAQAPPPPGQ